jgi:hypothetical protein
MARQRTAGRGGPPPVVNVAVDDERRCGQYVDLRDADVDPSAVAAAVRGRQSAVVVRCPAPGPAFEHVGVIRPDTDVDLRRALAAVARVLGNESPRNPDLAAVRAELVSLSPPRCDVSAARRAVADAGDAEQKLAERVAALRGEVRTLRDRNADATVAEAALESAVADLAEVRSERIAAEQRLDRERAQARKVRDRRERRLALQDRERNLERAVRRDLVEAVYPAFAEAVRSVPGDARPADAVGEYEGDDLTAVLALARLSPSPAPVVLALERFASPAQAARRLGRPVLRV